MKWQPIVWLSRVWLWWTAPPQPVPPLEPQPAPAPPTKPTHRAKLETGRAAEIEETGRWYFKRDILDKLDEYMRCIRQMRRTDPDAYGLYSKVGAVIMSEMGQIIMADDTVPLAKGLTFGAVAFLADSTKDTLGAKFVYFQKLRRIKDIGRYWLTHGDTYKVSLFLWDDYKDDKHPERHDFSAPVSFHVHVHDGNVRVLREQMTISQQLPRSNRRIEHHAWDYACFLKEQGHPPRPCDPQERGRTMFLSAYNGYASASMDVRVACSKGQDTAAFAVDLLRLPYFFADRDVMATTASGQRKRVMHIVRTHARGKGHVRSHFRGERRFSWNGYDVQLSMPGKHHADLLGMDFAGQMYDEDEAAPPGMLTLPQMGTKLQHHLRG